MRIELDTNEMAAILRAWAGEKYHTHNVSVEAFKNGSVVLLVTPQEDEFGQNKVITVNKPNPAIEKLAQLQVDQEPDYSFTPDALGQVL